jgi:hypothetical protein
MRTELTDQDKGVLVELLRDTIAAEKKDAVLNGSLPGGKARPAGV